MKTIVYVDGYNLYYGRLANTPYKWLAVAALFQEIVRVQDPSSHVVAVKYFTAHAVARYARHGVASEKAQKQYHRALEIHSEGLLSVILGRHSLNEKALPTVIPGKEPDKSIRTPVWVVVEKKSDVNLAMAMYRDAAKNRCAQCVLCSNDSDAQPALEAMKEDFPNHRIGLVAPTAPGTHGSNVVLANLADWKRKDISDNELLKAQLPLRVVNHKGKVFTKPAHW